jgi:hypothetical protein
MKRITNPIERTKARSDDSRSTDNDNDMTNKEDDDELEYGGTQSGRCEGVDGWSM